MFPIVLGYLFAFIYLIMFSIGANRYNRNMDQITGLLKVLRHPNVKKETVKNDFFQIQLLIKKRQKFIYAIFGGLMLLHYVETFLNNMAGFYFFIPLIMCVAFTVLILFFYSFKGGKVIHYNEYNNTDIWGY
jgi:hypothetical protein